MKILGILIFFIFDQPVSQKYVAGEKAGQKAGNLDFSAIVQYFTGDPGTKTRAAMGFLRLKYSF